MNRFATLFAAIAILLLAGSAAASSLNGLSYMTEQYPPYNYQEGGQLKGISIDLIKNVFQKTGASKSVSDVELVPWANGYAQVQSDAGTCLFAMTRTSSRESLFKWAGPIVSSEVIILTKKGSGVSIGSKVDLQKYTLGVIRDDVGQNLLKEAGYPESKMDITSKLDSLLKKLAMGRVDGIAYDNAVSAHAIKQAGYSPGDFGKAYSLSKSQLFYAFHKSTPDSTVAEFQKALDELEAAGVRQQIIDSYMK